MVRNLIACLLMVVALAACTKEQVVPTDQLTQGEDKRMQEEPSGSMAGAAAAGKGEPEGQGAIVRSGDLDEQGGGEDDGDISDDGDEDADGERNKKKNNGSTGN
ncbi:MAG TPA: hypothetical protein PLH93_03965 [Flavobacteriales bacterium]|nr:hypothetical protein [Flavobacteriales bacterium]MCC6399282.1 hypothetical protein [Flavobacteriales bacterium]HQW86315.1 hypothetical protein [Flavobacteriales bacterium]